MVVNVDFICYNIAYLWPVRRSCEVQEAKICIRTFVVNFPIHPTRKIRTKLFNFLTTLFGKWGSQSDL